MQFIIQSSLGIHIGLVPGGMGIPNSVAVQVPHVKWHRAMYTVSPPHL